MGDRKTLPAPRSRRFNPVSLFVIVAVPALCLASACTLADDAWSGFALYGICFASIVVEGGCLWTWRRLSGRLFDAYSLVLTGMWLFNGGGIAFSQVITPDVEEILAPFKVPAYRVFDRGDVLRSFYVVLLCLSAMHLGALLAGWRWRKKRPVAADPDARTARARDSMMSWVGLGLIGISLGPAILIVLSGAEKVRQGGYMALYQAEYRSAEGGRWYELLASGLVPGALYLIASSRGDRRLVWLGRLAIGGYSAALLSLGLRAQAFQNLVALLWFHHYGERPIRRTAWVVLIASGLVVSSTIYWSRVHAGTSAIDLESLGKATGSTFQNLLFPITEMGSSLITVVYVQDLVPRERDYGWGETYLDSILSALPGLALPARPGETRDLCEWLAWAACPRVAANGGGLGFSLVAEAYLNYGPAGAPVVFGLGGFALGWFACWSHANGRSRRLAYAACVISIVLFSARGSSATFARRLLVLGAIPYAMVRLAGHQRGKAPLRGATESRVRSARGWSGTEETD